MKHNPAISVIMPVYNVERYVEESIRSVLAQSFGDFELIAIDDCSTDRTLEVCRRIAQSDGRITVLRNKHNLGPGETRNLGLNHARGKYITFVDGDDYIMPHALETLYRAAEQSNAEVVHCSSYIQREQLPDGSFSDQAILKSDPRPREGFLIDDKNIRLQEVYANFGMWIMLWLNLYRRDFLNRHSIRFPKVVGEDEPFFVAVLCAAERFFCINDRFYVYNRRLKSETRGDNVASQRVLNGVTALVENCRYITAALERTKNLSAETKSACLQEYIERVTRNYILRRYDFAGLQSADAMQNFTRALEPTFGKQSEFAARLLQGLAFRQLRNVILERAQQTPTLSVIIPLFDAEPFIEHCLVSVLSQTLQDIEVIVVDDCSTDRSAEIVEKLAARDFRLKLLRHDQKRGKGSARNAALERARGKYVFFLDCEDILLKNAMEDLFRAAEETNAEVVHSTAFLNMYEKPDGTFDNNLQMQSDQNPVQGMLPADRIERLSHCRADSNLTSMPMLNLYRRDFLERNQLHFSNDSSAADESFSLAILCFAERFLCIPNYFYIRRRFVSKFQS